MRRVAWWTPDSSCCFLNGQRSRSLPFASDGTRRRRSTTLAHREFTPGTPWGGTTKASTTRCSLLSPSAGLRATSTGSRKAWRADEADLREVTGREASRRAPALRTALRRGPGRAATTRGAPLARDCRAGDRSPFHRALEPELRHRHGFLSAGLLHDEVQPARQRAPCDAAGLP